HSRLAPGVTSNSDIEMGYPLIFRIVASLLPIPGAQLGSARLQLQDIYFHPTAIAAWVGMFATALNLLPSGQLDGGHIVYALAPRAHRVISWLTVIALGVMGRSSYTWWFWAALITVMNILTYRQEQAPKYPMLPASRWILGGVALIMLVLTITIAPFQVNWK